MIDVSSKHLHVRAPEGTGGEGKGKKGWEAKHVVGDCIANAVVSAQETWGLSCLWIEALDLKIGNEKLDRLLVDFVLPELPEFDNVVEECRVGHAREAVRLERSLEELYLLLGDVELKRLHRESLRKRASAGKAPVFKSLRMRTASENEWPSTSQTCERLSLKLEKATSNGRTKNIQRRKLTC